MPRRLSLLTVILGMTVAVSLPGRDLRWEVETAGVWNDNVTNADVAENQLGALAWRTEVRTGVNRSLTAAHRVGVDFGARTEIWPRFEGLDLVAPGLAARWSYKPGLGPHTPLLVAEGISEWAFARESARSGWVGVGRLYVQQRVGLDWQFTAGYETRQMAARGLAFDAQGTEWFGRALWTLRPRLFLGLEARQRSGDVVAYSRPPRPDLILKGKVLTLVDTFEQSTPWIAYYFPAVTRSGAVELSRVFDGTTVGLRYEFRQTTHGGSSYNNRLMLVRFLLRF